MDIAITGASGLIGQALVTSLRERGDRPVALVRRPARTNDEISWNPAAGTIDAASLEGIGAVVHLAGAGIGDKKWTDERKTIILESRTLGTRLLATTLAGLQRPPSVFVSGSAIGLYGSRGDEELTEASTAGSGFLADLCVAWEQAAQPTVDAGIRTALARTGIVMSTSGGALKKQLPLFKLGLGGRFGSGDQWLGWISITDQVRALQHLIDGSLAGPVNLAAPTSVTNLEFTKTLGAILKRPTLLPVPLAGPRLLFGRELVEELLLASQRVIPETLIASGFQFTHPSLEPALRSMLDK